MISAPTCRTCGKTEWRHVCSGAADGATRPRNRAAIGDTDKKLPKRKPKRKAKSA